MKNEKEYVFSYEKGVINVSLTWDNLFKLIQYLILSTLSISIGWMYSCQSVSFDAWLKLVSILPTLYIFNHMYYVLLDFISKYFIKNITWIKEDNRDNIWQSHALMFNVFVIYIYFKIFFSKLTNFHSGQAVITILVLYSVFCFIHRCLRNFDCDYKHGCDNIYLGKKLFSLLRFKSFTHSHILSGTVIALPFLIGLLLGNTNSTIMDIIVDSIYAYSIFILAWVVIYQHKCKAWEFVQSIKFILPCSVYPVFPIMYFMFFDNSIYTFYLLYGLLLILYLCPLIFINFTNNEKVKYINEKMVLGVILFTISMSLLCHIVKSCPTQIVKAVENDYLGISGLSAMLISSSVAVFITNLRSKSNDYQRFFHIYTILPYLIIVVVHTILTVSHQYLHISILNSSIKLNYISGHIVAILCAYAIIYVAGNIYQFAKKPSVQT